MPRQSSTIRVFVASPSDVEEERAILDRIVRELNLTWADSLGLQLELIRWETHAAPGIGEDPQAVINSQLGDEYDIFLGLMWARFGTPTLRAGSGTAEEFEGALARHRADPTNVDIMFYFKDSPLPPSAINPDQLAAAQNFRTRLGEEGVFYWTFRGSEDFQSLLRIHLSRKAQAWRKRLASTHLLPAPVPHPAESVVEEALVVAEVQELSELGLLELMEIYENAFLSVGDIVDRMTRDLHKLLARLEARTAETLAIGRADTSPKIQAAKRVMQRTADDMNQYVQRTRVELPLFSAELTRAIQAYGRAFTLTTDFGSEAEDQVRTSLEEISSLRNAIASEAKTAGQMKANVASIPRMSSDLITATKNTVAILGDTVDEYETADRLLSEVVASMTEWLSRL